MSAADAFKEKIVRLLAEGKDGATENEIRKTEKEALHEAIDLQLGRREGRMAEAIFQGDTGKLWDLIAAAIENWFIYHFDLNREDAGKMRGRHAVNIKKEEPRRANDDNVKDGPNVVDGDNKNGRWMSRAGKRSMQANRLINVARRM